MLIVRTLESISSDMPLASVQMKQVCLSLKKSSPPIESGRLPMKPNQAVLSQSGPVHPQGDDARSMRAIRDYEDQYPEAFHAPTWKAPQRDTKDKNNNKDEGYDEHEHSDDSAQTYSSSLDDNYCSEDLDYEVPKYRERSMSREPRARGPDNFSDFFPSRSFLSVTMIPHTMER
jgi:hypothetical protein